MSLSQCRPLMAVISFLGLASLASAVDMTYCSSLNTADGSANSSTYQSDGLCTEFCSGYAFAVLQYKDCWCSNYVPASSEQVDTSDCNTECPGYPSDTCGGDGLYGYIGLSANPSGTKGGDSTTAAATTTQGTIVTSTVQNTVTVDPTTSSTTQTSTTETHTSTDSTTTDDAATTTAAASPTLVSTITQGGSVMTVTVMPTNGAAASSSTADVSTSQKGLSTGAAVGTAVGVLGAVGIIVAAGFFFWFRRKRQEQEEGSMLQHQNSFRGSSAGIMSTPRTEMASVWNDEAQSVGRRSSRLMPHDPRMDPYATNIYGRFDNKSRESINTLRDDQDYSRRVLRTTNPDLPGDN